ncbi:MAG TPA: V-type ATP synthase subunit D [Gammaproteobacteria bacterium]|nr:V-type ATP synthase subunit D [Gammaproteobacteria bacterium]
MPEAGGHAPTHSALLELREEQQVMQEGYRFLDEKRLLLAAEIVRRIRDYEAQRERFNEMHRQASAALRQTVRRHGLEGTAVYPAAPLDASEIRLQRRSFLGVTLIQPETTLQAEQPAGPAENPSPEARHCATRFRTLLEQNVILAAITGNLHRLLEEYRRTERRARALEDVLLPEIRESLHELEAHLEDIEQEEAVRVRLDYSQQ